MYDEAKLQGVDFWAWDEGADVLTHTTPEEAIEHYLDWLWPDPPPKTITLQGFRKSKVPSECVPLDLEDILERLDEEYGDPSASYCSWICEQVTTLEVDLTKWEG